MTTQHAVAIDLNILTDEAADTYHGQSKKNLSSHQLADFRKCPLLYERKLKGLIVEEESPAFLLGRAVHTRVLEGAEAYRSGFAVGGPVNPKTQKPFGADSQAFRAWAELQGKPVLSQDQADLVERIASGVGANTKAVGLLVDGKAEGVVRVEYCGISCQARFDWVNPRRGIVDLKTCDDLTWFEADARRFGYVHQLAFYRSVLAAALEVPPLEIPIWLVGIEKREPFRCGVWQVSEEVLGIATKDNESCIDRLKCCRATGIWPSGYEAIRNFDWI